MRFEVSGSGGPAVPLIGLANFGFRFPGSVSRILAFVFEVFRTTRVFQNGSNLCFY